MIDVDKLEASIRSAAGAGDVAGAPLTVWGEIFAEMRNGQNAQRALINIRSQANVAVAGLAR